MGTNFYWIAEEEGHIGKRSGAGLWCYDCDVTLFKGDISRLHYGDGEWYTNCPVCGKTIGTTTCSFTWAKDPHDVYVRCCLKAQEFLVSNEYGMPYTGVEFLKELQDCKIKYEDLIGREFC